MPSRLDHRLFFHYRRPFLPLPSSFVLNRTLGNFTPYDQVSLSAASRNQKSLSIAPRKQVAIFTAPRSHVAPIVLSTGFATSPILPHDESMTGDDFADDYSEDYSEAEIKDGILEAALEFVPRLGWTRESISTAAELYGYPGLAHGMFPGGGADLANYFYSKCNAELRERMEEDADEEVPCKRAFIRAALKQRLEMTLEVKDRWHEAMAVLSSRDGIEGALKNLFELVDDIWHYAGDRSVDASWYTRRTALAAIYKSTEFYMLQDMSQGCEETWAFLDRRLDDAFAVGSTIRRQEQLVNSCLGSLVAVAATFVNMSGTPAK